MCLTLAVDVRDRSVETIEGLGTGGEPHPLQEAFARLGAAQCGFCTNGMIMTAKALLDKTPKPTEAQIKKALAANLCRCGTHTRMIKAVQRAARDMRGVQ